MSSYPDVHCPTCKRRGGWLSGEYGPFCSKRCKLVDLGAWFNEDNVISDPLTPDHFEDEELMS